MQNFFWNSQNNNYPAVTAGTWQEATKLLQEQADEKGLGYVNPEDVWLGQP